MLEEPVASLEDFFILIELLLFHNEVNDFHNNFLSHSCVWYKTFTSVRYCRDILYFNALESDNYCDNFHTFFIHDSTNYCQYLGKIFYQFWSVCFGISRKSWRYVFLTLDKHNRFKFVSIHSERVHTQLLNKCVWSVVKELS